MTQIRIVCLTLLISIAVPVLVGLFLLGLMAFIEKFGFWWLVGIAFAGFFTVLIIAVLRYKSGRAIE